MRLQDMGLTGGGPLLLGRTLSSRLCDVEMLQPVFLLFVDNLVFGVQAAQLADGSYPRWVVGCDGGALEALVEDARSQTKAFGVVCGVEDLALNLIQSVRRAQCPWSRRHLPSSGPIPAAVVLPW